MNKYKLIEQIFYKYSLSSSFVREASFDIEQLLFLNKNKVFTDNHVFIMGMARAGTTILLEAVYKSKKFASLSYLNMPLLLAPNLWSGNKNKHYKYIERAHGDGIMISQNSPEAFEEVFWQTFDENESKVKFKIYINLILKSCSKNRYLSKNNQNITRIKTIQEIFPKSKLLIVFKNPVSHASSLLKQHIAFIKLQKEDKFIKNFMDLIYHSEFGLSYKPIISKGIFYKDDKEINHWLEQWYLVYSNIIKQNKRIVFVDGESLRPNSESWNNICELLNLSSNHFDFIDTRKKTIPHFNLDLDLYYKCKKIYEELQSISI